METRPKISLILIHYNTPQYLEGCINSILTQTYPNIEIIFIDNNSPDKSGINFVKEKYGENSKVIIIDNTENLGYAKAANQGIRMAIEGKSAQEAIMTSTLGQSAPEKTTLRADFHPADYVVITNPDIIYTEEYFSKIINRMEKDPKIAAITGKIYKYDFDRQKPTNIIDTVGLFAYKNRRIIDDGQGLIDEGQFNEECEVFGVSGACPLYRVSALREAMIMGEYMDEDFFMYKEDVDLCWRFLLYGWKNLFYPRAIAYHGRGTGVYRRFFNKEVLRNRDKLSKFQKQYSFKNQYLLQAKNELWSNFFRNFFPIIFRKFATFAYITFKEPYLWGSYLKYLKQLPRALKKRSIIMKNRRVSAREMQQWFKKQSKYLKK